MGISRNQERIRCFLSEGLYMVQNRAHSSAVGTEPIELLRQRGVQVTAQRLAVLRALSARPHATADDVVEMVRNEIGAISRRAVYDVVALLSEKGLLRRIQPSGSAARYETRVGDNHHHLICRTCGLVLDVDCALGATPCLTPSDEFGYEIDEAEVNYWGLCPQCQQTTSRSHRSNKALEERHE